MRLEQKEVLSWLCCLMSRKMQETTRCVELYAKEILVSLPIKPYKMLGFRGSELDYIIALEYCKSLLVVFSFQALQLCCLNSAFLSPALSSCSHSYIVQPFLVVWWSFLDLQSFQFRRVVLLRCISRSIRCLSAADPTSIIQVMEWFLTWNPMHEGK